MESKNCNASVLDDSDDALQSECSICLDNLCTHTHSVCGGIFCGSCVANIVQGTGVCPTCRQRFKSASEILKIIPFNNCNWDDEQTKKLTTESLQQEIDTWLPKSNGNTESKPEKHFVTIKTLDGVEHKINLFPGMPAPRLRGAIALVSGKCAEEIELIFDNDLITCKKIPSFDQEEDRDDQSDQCEEEWNRWEDREEKKGKLTLLGLQEQIDEWSSGKEKIKVMIKMLDGQRRAVNLYADMTTSHLKKIIANVSGVCYQQIRLILCGMPMWDDFPLSRFNLVPGATIHCIMQMRGS